MKYHIRVLSLILLPVFSTCTKVGKNVTVKGHVYNALTGEGVEGIEFVLQNDTGPLYWMARKRVKTDESDADGKYNVSGFFASEYVSIDASSTDNYYKLGWWKDGAYTDNLAITKGKTVKADYYVIPQGQLKVIVNNINCEGSSDSLVVTENYTFWVNVKPLTFTYLGCNPPQSLAYNRPAGNYEIQWTVFRNGSQQSGSVSTQVTEGALQVVPVNY